METGDQATADERGLLGIHLADDSLRVARLQFGSAGPSLVAAGIWPLPAHAIGDGVVCDRDHLIEVAAEVGQWAGPVDEVRVALATPELAVCRATILDHALSRQLADSWTSISVTEDQVACGSVVVLGQDDRLVVAARYSSVVRAAEAMAPLGAPIAIDALPLALLRVAPVLLAKGQAPSAIRLREGGLCWEIELPDLSVEVSLAKAFGAATDLSILYRQGTPAPSDDWAATVSIAKDLRQPAMINQLAVAMGAALGGIACNVAPLDLGTPEFLVPLQVAEAGEHGVTWLVERAGPIEVTHLDPVLMSARPA